MHLLLWMNGIVNFICTGATDLRGSDSKRKKKFEHAPLALKVGDLEQSATLTADKLRCKRLKNIKIETEGKYQIK